jgi:hypothetical protein
MLTNKKDFKASGELVGENKGECSEPAGCLSDKGLWPKQRAPGHSKKRPVLKTAQAL